MRRYWTTILLLLILVGLAFLNSGVRLWMDWLWFQETGYTILFSKSLITRLAMGLIAGVLFFLIVWGNAFLARQFAGEPTFYSGGEIIEIPQLAGVKSVLHRVVFGVALFLSYVVGSWAGSHWETYLRYREAVPFGAPDPLFQIDIGFYVFTVPFYHFLYNAGFVALLFAFLASLLVYLVEGGIWLTRRGPQVARAVRVHLLGLVGVFLILLSFHYRLDIYDLLLSDRGIIFGASYADIEAQLPALRILVWVSLLAAVLVLATAFGKSYTPAIGGVLLLVGVSIIGNRIYPEIIQRFEVAPNEIVKESPYLALEIQYTRMAYGIDQVEEEEFPALENLTPEALKRNESTLQNIRLWDHKPLLRTYGQLQVIRPYYEFVDVDNDRYQIDGQYRQVSLSPRELDSSRLPSRIWINEHLTYTHGYGLALGPVNQFTREGLPQFLIKDIPPQASTGIEVSRPQIYFGEITDSYCFVKTKAKEFDFPSGDENVYTDYSGTGGIPVNSFFRKLLFGFHFKEPKIILSSDITGESRLMFGRDIQTRVRKLLPFLRYDADPYMVIAEDGHLYWIVDGYTVDSRFPYSRPTPRLGNYVRNSVKATIDAYNGTVNFYLSDPKDPLIQTYARVFPGVFQPLDSMPADLRKHIRYPEDLFAIQAEIYATYHMTDPQVFYNKEDLWRIPSTSQGGSETALEPYYTIMKLNTAEAKEEFILMIPFAPARRENMIAWMAARCDEPNYGQLVVYNFPKQRLVYGPSQIINRINQDPEISKQLSLWNQGGSTVIRGSLLVIPVDESILYIQPLYLAAAREGALPELKRVFVAFGNNIAMEETLEFSLSRIFGESGVRTTPGTATAPGGPGVPSSGDLVSQAASHYQRAQEAIRQGNWSVYGEEIRQLGEVIRKMQEQPRRP
ncbi:MAG: UPF0182 family protein [Acidobacteriota bacterium]